jgi:hypothetical protein
MGAAPSAAPSVRPGRDALSAGLAGESGAGGLSAVGGENENGDSDLEVVSGGAGSATCGGVSGKVNIAGSGEVGMPAVRTIALTLSPIDFKVVSVALCTSSACIVPRSMFMFNVIQDSTAFKSAICLSTLSTDSVGIAMPGTFMPPPHMFLTNSSVSFMAPIPGIWEKLADIDSNVGDLDMVGLLFWLA